MSRDSRARAMPIKQAVSAGGVVYRLGPEGFEVALVVRDDPGIWALPKGGLLEGETIEEAAAREVEEETGLQVQVVESLGPIDYWFVSRGESVRYHKTVHHFLFRAVGGSIANHDHEYDRVVWLPIATAPERMSYENEALVVRRAEHVLMRRYPDLDRATHE
ncbi:MAG: NUDIX domain-containing protein [Dehalococcoidia bacterium]|nr:NUDIX domain-containing protein [Dehalococcoidia bacterium]